MLRTSALKERAHVVLANGQPVEARHKYIREAAIACALIAFAAPLLLLVALAVRIEGAGPLLVGKTIRIGELLRYSRLDRLPRLFNVLRGELALARLLD